MRRNLAYGDHYLCGVAYRIRLINITIKKISFIYSAIYGINSKSKVLVLI